MIPMIKNSAVSTRINQGHPETIQKPSRYRSVLLLGSSVARAFGLKGQLFELQKRGTTRLSALPRLDHLGSGDPYPIISPRGAHANPWVINGNFNAYQT
jgi:hypothetical protein